MKVTLKFLIKYRKNIPIKTLVRLLMGLGVNALESLLNRISKKTVVGNQLISVVAMNADGTVDYPENCSKGILLVPHKMTEAQWELQNVLDQNGKSSES